MVSWTTFGLKLTPISDFELSGDKWTVLTDFILFLTMKLISKGKFCVFVAIRSWDIEIPIFFFYFSAFFHGGFFFKCPRRVIASRTIPAKIFIFYSAGPELMEHGFLD